MLILPKDLYLKPRVGETEREHEHRYFSPFRNCPTCTDIDVAVRRKQTQVLNAATNIGLPRRFARDLYIDCQTIEMQNPRSFGLVLRELGSQLAYGDDPESYTAALYFVDKDDMQAFFIYEQEGEDSYETAELRRVSKGKFVEWCEERGGKREQPYLARRR